MVYRLKNPEGSRLEGEESVTLIDKPDINI